jgi:uroporphyrin-III C-methyltransferase/precorrin-2 dehydrogenase/sirohydrochlorin ferrochelatase/uroporphyrin-III C-methyltransferase
MNQAATVYLVGAGPGNADLLTLKAYRLMQQADVVIYDRLIGEDILDMIPATAQRIFVGKRSGHHSLPQDEINQLLVQLSTRHRHIVRLKGGDPFIFGRGSEEALFLKQHNIAFEIVPGVTAAAACSAYAGVPLTHRGLSRNVKLMTGHFRDDEALQLSASDVHSDTTLVIYMGLSNLQQICRSLMCQGIPANRPAMAIQDGTSAQQRRVISNVKNLPQQVKAAGLKSPVLIVISNTVVLARQLDWFDPQVIQDEDAHAKWLEA